MTQKYKADDVVYNWCFDLGTADLKCHELIVYRWDYMDGMQWRITDEYMLMNEITVPFLKYFKKKKTETIRRPGYLISSDKRYAKFLLLVEMVKSFGYALENSEKYVSSEGTMKAVRYADKELKKMSDEYPELLIKSYGEFMPEETNSGWLWS